MYQLICRVFCLILVGCISLGCFIRPVWAENYERLTMIGADLSGQDLTDSSFTQAKFPESNFSHTNLREVSLFGANLEESNFEGADLSYATLSTARLVKANLTNAILEGVLAYNTQFSGATIAGADFTDALIREDELKKLCAIASGTNPMTGRDTRESLNCDYL
jgi:uncharacterized protein YjbI with pentapeptide repeats